MQKNADLTEKSHLLQHMDMDYELHFSFEIHAETVQRSYAAAQ